MCVHVCVTHAHKRLCMCVCARMFFCVSVCFHVCMCAYRQLSVSACLRTCVHVCVWVCLSCDVPSVYVKRSVWLCACACAHVRTSVSDRERVREVLCAYATLRM